MVHTKIGRRHFKTIDCRDAFGHVDPPPGWRALSAEAGELADSYRPRGGVWGGIFNVEPESPRADEGSLKSMPISSAQSTVRRMFDRLNLGGCAAIAAINLNISHATWLTGHPGYRFSFSVAVLGCRTDVRSLVDGQVAFANAAGKMTTLVPKMPMDAPTIQLRELMRNSLARSLHDFPRDAKFAPTPKQFTEAERWWRSHSVEDRLFLVGLELRAGHLVGNPPSSPIGKGQPIRWLRRRPSTDRLA